MAFCLENHPRLLEVAWGCHYAGLRYTAASSRLTSDELAYVLDDCDAQAFITSRYKADQAAELVGPTDHLKLRLMLDGVIDGYESYEPAVASQPIEPLPDRREGGDMLYSSGTTGRPKGVKQPIEPLPLGEAPALVPLLSFLFGFTPESVYLSPAPMYHAAPLRFSMSLQRLGSTVVIMEHFDAEAALVAIERYHVTDSQWVPTMFVRMLKLDAATRARYDVSSLRSAVHAAAPCPVEVKRQMIEWWGPILHEYYAGTEGNGFVYCTSEQWLAHPGTVGTAITGIVHVVGEDGHDCPAGEQGSVYFEGGASFEYHKDAAKTESTRNERGWTTLGDVGYLDADNFLYLTDRKAHMIISGGVNVYPQEAENVLIGHPQVVDVAVFGIPHDEYGEEVKAVVQPVTMPAAPSDADALARDLIAYCRTYLSDIKCPRSIDFREELPRHPTGKLYTRLLKDEYWVGRTNRIG